MKDFRPGHIRKPPPSDIDIPEPPENAFSIWSLPPLRADEPYEDFEQEDFDETTRIARFIINVVAATAVVFFLALGLIVYFA